MSALSLFYMAISPLLKKRYSEKGRYYTWLIIVVGLIVPLRPQWSDAIVKIDVPSVVTVNETPTVQTENETLIFSGTQVYIAPDNIPVDDTAFFLATPGVLYWQIAAVIWLAGVLVFLLYHVIKYYRFTKLVMRWSERITDERTLVLLQSLKAEMKISNQIILYQCLDIGSPAMFGFVNPRILLPKAKMAEDELNFILKHELVHYKRKDLYYKCLVLIAAAIHWFNPVIYLITRVIGAQCELSCDAEIVRNTDADTRQQYSETIIGVVRYQSRLKTALSTNFYGGKKSMKNRISSIMDTGKRKTGMVIICVALVVTLGTGVVFAANAVNASSKGNVYIDEQEGAAPNALNQDDEIALDVNGNPAAPGGRASRLKINANPSVAVENETVAVQKGNGDIDEQEDAALTVKKQDGEIALDVNGNPAAPGERASRFR